MLKSSKSSVLEEKVKPVKELPIITCYITAKSASNGRSSLLYNSETQLMSISKPSTLYFLPNSIASSNPT